MFYFFAVVWIMIGVAVLFKEAILPIVGSAFVTFLMVVFLIGAIWVSFAIGQFIGSATGVFVILGTIMFILGCVAILLSDKEQKEENTRYVGWCLGFVAVPAIILVGVFDFIENHSTKVLSLIFVLLTIDGCYIYTQIKKQKERRWQNQRLELAKSLLRSAHEEEMRKEVNESEPLPVEIRLLAKKHLILNDDIQLASKTQREEIMQEWREGKVQSKLNDLYEKELSDRGSVERIIAKYGTVASSQDGEV